MTRRPPQHPHKAVPREDTEGSWSSHHPPACRALGTWTRAPQSPDLRGPGAVGWTQRHKEVTHGLPATTRPAGLPRAGAGQQGETTRAASGTACPVQATPRLLRLCRGPQRPQAAFRPQTRGRGPLPPQQSPATCRLLLCPVSRSLPSVAPLWEKRPTERGTDPGGFGASAGSSQGPGPRLRRAKFTA